MSEEHLLIDFIEDFSEENILQAAKFRLLVLEKNIANLKKNIEHLTNEKIDSKKRIDICVNRMEFIDNDMKKIEDLKCDIEAKLALIIENVGDPNAAPVEFDPELELFIDQKIEYYTNTLLGCSEVEIKKKNIARYIEILEERIVKNKNEQAMHQEKVDGHANWVPELRTKIVETASDMNIIQGDILSFFEGNTTGISQPSGHLLKERFDLMQTALDNRMKTVIQLNSFALHMQTECDEHKCAIVELDKKNRALEEEIEKTKVILEGTNLDVENESMKQGKLEEQIVSYIKIQETLNLVSKCTAYYDLLSAYEKEKANVREVLTTFQEKHINESHQISTWEAYLANYMYEKTQLEAEIRALANDD